MRVLLLARPDCALLPWLRAHGEEVVQTLDPPDPAWLDRERFDFLISYGYPRVLGAEVLERFPGAALNLHISLLPFNRGSHPNLWSWVHDTPKGVTIHHMDPGIDTGDIVVQREVALDDGGTLASTHAILTAAIEELFRESWPAMRAKTAPRRPQPPGGSFHLGADGEAFVTALATGWDTPVSGLRRFLPYGRQTIDDGDVETVANALRGAWITQGPTVAAFEEALAAYTGARHAVAFANGTAALHGAAFVAGLGPGDELLTTPITFVADANCALYLGARPHFADIDPATWNLDTAAAARGATGPTKAIVPVSFAGLPVDLEPLRELRDRVTIVEDGCHALGGHRGGARVGGPGIAHMTVFSFHPVKPITTAEGGAVTTEDDALAERLRSFRTHGIVREVEPPPCEGGWYYDVRALGFNYRLTDVQSALGIRQLQRLDEWIAARNEVAARYRELLAEEHRVALPPAAPEGSLHAYHLFAVHVRAGAEARLRAFEHLRAAGIGTQVHYIPIYRFSYYRDVLGAAQDACPEAERYYAGALSLPMYPGLTPADQERVVRQLRAAL